MKFNAFDCWLSARKLVIIFRLKLNDMTELVSANGENG
jgi:hypothetical protein